MSLYKNKYRVESNRLENWDYAGKGIYFITLYDGEKIYTEIIVLQ